MKFTLGRFRIKISHMSEWQMIIGHDWATEMLAQEAIRDRIGHAYLFTGPAQIGKTTIARTFAQALNCQEPRPHSRPCGQCRPCRLIRADRHPDIIQIKGAVSSRGRRTIKIDQIRDLQHGLSLSASEARYKVAIIAGFEDANPSAANAFLKTLEEPPERVVLLLTSSDADTLLPTVVSRCRRINLRYVPGRQIQEALTSRWQTPEEQARLLAQLSQGRVGWAIQAANEASTLAERNERLQTLRDILDSATVERFKASELLARQPDGLPTILLTWLSWWRDLTLVVYGAGDKTGIANIDWQSKLERLSNEWPADQTRQAVRNTENAIWQLQSNANARLVIENLLLTYPQTKRYVKDET